MRVTSGWRDVWVADGTAMWEQRASWLASKQPSSADPVLEGGWLQRHVRLPCSFLSNPPEIFFFRSRGRKTTRRRAADSKRTSGVRNATFQLPLPPFDEEKSRGGGTTSRTPPGDDRGPATEKTPQQRHQTCYSWTTDSHRSRCLRQNLGLFGSTVRGEKESLGMVAWRR